MILIGLKIFIFWHPILKEHSTIESIKDRMNIRDQKVLNTAMQAIFFTVYCSVCIIVIGPKETKLKPIEKYFKTAKIFFFLAIYIFYKKKCIFNASPGLISLCKGLLWLSSLIFIFEKEIYFQPLTLRFTIPAGLLNPVLNLTQIKHFL